MDYHVNWLRGQGYSRFTPDAVLCFPRQLFILFLTNRTVLGPNIFGLIIYVWLNTKYIVLFCKPTSIASKAASLFPRVHTNTNPLVRALHALGIFKIGLHEKKQNRGSGSHALSLRCRVVLVESENVSQMREISRHNRNDRKNISLYPNMIFLW